MTWTYDPATGQWSDNWDGTTYAPGSLQWQGTPPKAAPFLALVDIDQTTADAVWRSMLRQIWAELHANRRVCWPNMFSLNRYTSKAHDKRNPRTGEIIKVPDRLRLKIRNAIAFRDAINKRR